MKCYFACAAAVVTTFFIGAAAQAATYAYVAVPDNTVLNVGQTTTISVYLTETFSDLADSTIGNELGLFSAGVFVNQLSTTATTPTQVLLGSDVVVAPEFDPQLETDVVIDSDGVSVKAFAFAAGVEGTIDGNVRTIKIADVTFTAGDEGVTTYQLIDPPDTSDTSTFDLLNTTYLDALFPAQGPTLTFTVVIPEPASLGVASIGVAALLRRRR
jgi:hypothetical protein